jgi:hypothetical protein
MCHRIAAPDSSYFPLEALRFRSFSDQRSYSASLNFDFGFEPCVWAGAGWVSILILTGEFCMSGLILRVGFMLYYLLGRHS